VKVNILNKTTNRSMAVLMRQLFDRLTGKEAVISYGFRNIKIDIPKAAGLQGQNLGSANGYLGETWP
jgi:hypothetical protein